MTSRLATYLICVISLIAVSPSFAAGFCPATGHYYDFVHTTNCPPPSTFTWTAARDAAVAAGGYLATVTSAAEQVCMTSIQGGNWRAYFAGGSDAAGEGQWRWVTGPETGNLFTYTKWFAGEPNNSGNEDYLSWNTGGVVGQNNFWNDVGHWNNAVCGYAIEWDSNPDAVDTDGDGVDDALDVCTDTVIPEGVPTKVLGVNRWALVDGNGDFDTTPPPGGGKGPELAFSVEDTAGCSCEQIISALDLGKGHEKHGCSISAMEAFVELVNP